MKIISWNVAGINACMKKGLIDSMKKENAEVYCFQEVKATKEKMPKFIDGYEEYHSFADKKGYSGVSTLTKVKPLNVIYGIGEKEFDSEGRMVTLEFEEFFVINVYFPNSQRELKRLDFKLKFNNLFLKFCKKLEKKKPILAFGDFNVAHTELDIKNAKANEKNAGFTKEERNWFTEFLKNGFVDTFREFVKEGDHYTWWTYRNNARERNIGWRIDYSVASESIKNKITESKILNKVYGSDHCPISLTIKVKK